jgi:hypothetical protein
VQAFRRTGLSKTSQFSFASGEHTTRSEKPYWPDMVLNRRVRPAVTALKITELIGWHTFRHANARIIMKLSAQAFTQDKRTAQTKVVQMILQKTEQIGSGDETHSGTRKMCVQIRFWLESKGFWLVVPLCSHVGLLLYQAIVSKVLILLVGDAGFEPATSTV